MLKKYLQYIILIHISYYCLKIDLLQCIIAMYKDVLKVINSYYNSYFYL